MSEQDWRFARCKLTGRDHMENGTECQDRVDIDTMNHSAALADGLGSKFHSADGAETVTSHFGEIFANDFERVYSKEERARLQADPDSAGILEGKKGELKSELIRSLHAHLKAKAEGLPLSDITDLSCTLAFVVIMEKYQVAVAGCLGDSAVCVIYEEDENDDNEHSYVMTSRVDPNATASATNTIFAPNAESLLDLRFLSLRSSPRLLGFILTSDGLEKILFSKGSSLLFEEARIPFDMALNPEPRVREERIKNLLTQYVENHSILTDDISIAVVSRATKSVRLPKTPTWRCVCGRRNHITNTRCYNCREHRSIYLDYLPDLKNLKDPEKKIIGEMGVWAYYFRYLNRHPDEENRILGEICRYHNMEFPEDEEASETEPEETDDTGAPGYDTSSGTPGTPDMSGYDTSSGTPGPPELSGYDISSGTPGTPELSGYDTSSGTPGNSAASGYGAGDSTPSGNPREPASTTDGESGPTPSGGSNETEEESQTEGNEQGEDSSGSDTENHHKSGKEDNAVPDNNNTNGNDRNHERRPQKSGVSPSSIITPILLLVCALMGILNYVKLSSYPTDYTGFNASLSGRVDDVATAAHSADANLPASVEAMGPPPPDTSALTIEGDYASGIPYWRFAEICYFARLDGGVLYWGNMGIDKESKRPAPAGIGVIYREGKYYLVQYKDGKQTVEIPVDTRMDDLLTLAKGLTAPDDGADTDAGQ